MNERLRSTRRFKRLKTAYIVLCLCLDFIEDVSSVATKDHLKDKQSITQLKFASNKISNNDGKQDTSNTFGNSFSRKSRSLHNYVSSIFSDDENQYDILNESLETVSDPEIYATKKSKGSSLIPFPRLGRSSSFDPNSIMPYPDEWVFPYFQKAQDNLKFNEESILNLNSKIDDPDTYDSSDKDDLDSDMYDDFSSETIENEDSDLIEERQVDNNGTVIPYPRFGKRFQNSKVMFKDNNSMRKKRTSDSLIPQIRYGRSLNDPLKFSKFNKLNKQGILPYPRPGRSNDNEGKSAGYILPQPRFGRSTDEKSMEMVLKLKPLKNNKLSEVENMEENPFFLIPYPRPGKRFFGTKPLPPNVKLETKDKETIIQEIKEKEPALVTFLVPYPRPGRSNSESQSIIPSFRFGRSGTSMVPYPRPGRSDNPNSRKYMLPYPRLGRSDNKASLIPSVRFGKSTSFHSSSLLPYPRVGKSSDFILPYPRFGRASNGGSSMLPYLRFGRGTSSASMIPQMRVGKSDNSDLKLLMDELKAANKDLKVLNGMKMNDINQSSDNKDLQRESNEDVYGFKSDKNNIKSALLVPAKKLQKHMLTENTNYMLPYPRPGRTV